MPTVRRPVNVLYEVNRTTQTVAKSFSYTVPTTCLFAKVKAYGRMGDAVTYLGQPYRIGEEFEVAPGAVVTAGDSTVQLTLDLYSDGGTADSEGRIRSPAGQQQQIQSLVSGDGFSKLRFCIPGREVSGVQFKDVGLNGYHGVIGAGNSGAFATAGYMGTTAGTDGNVLVPAAAMAGNLITDSYIVAFAMRNATPGAAASMMALAGRSNNYCGIYLSHRTSGAMRAVVNLGNGTLISSADSVSSFSIASATFDQPYRHCILAWDGPTGSAYIYRDGIVDMSSVGLCAPGGANQVIGGAVTEVFAIGSQSFASSATSYVGVYRGVQGYRFAASGLPLNLGRLAAKLAAAPEIPLADAEFAF